MTATQSTKRSITNKYRTERSEEQKQINNLKKQTIMKNIEVTDYAANRINGIRANSFGTGTMEKDNLLSALTDSIRLATHTKEDEDLHGWTQGIENIQCVLCDYWEMRRDIEAVS